MRIAIINSVCGSGSTGKICVGISKMLFSNNIQNRIFYFEGNSDYKHATKCSQSVYTKFQALISRVLGNYGFNSYLSTFFLIKKLKKYNPDIVHIHNIHGHDVNLSVFIKWLKKNNKKVVWTLHDCWTFTGYCTYFSLSGCDKWKRECNSCPQCKKYSWVFDCSKNNYNKKKELLSGGWITFVTPSRWLCNLAKESFLKDSEVNVIYNGINIDVFSPKDVSKNNDRKAVLGVSFGWNERKGIDVFIELAYRLDDSYDIILVGTDSEIEKKLPSRIKTIRRTSSQAELAKIYSSCDVLVNPTKDEVFGMVNVEALACGLPVVTFNTGGAPESLNNKSGYVVECNDISALIEKIEDVCVGNKIKKHDCVVRGQEFEENKRYLGYLELYKRV